MSHVTPVKMGITNMDTLETAAKSLGCTVEKNATARLYGNQTKNGEMVIRIPGSPYDVAVNRQKDGTLLLETDFWGGHVGKKLGDRLGKLKQQYAVEKTRQRAKLLGHQLSQQTLPDGSVRIVVGVN